MFRTAIIMISILIPFGDSMAKDTADDFDSCKKGQVEVAKKASDYRGEDRIRRLIQADLTRARREEAEGDASECLEALDHAMKLIAGKY